MIKLKSKIVKSHVTDKARKYAINYYEKSWIPAWQTRSFMEGVEYAINELRDKKK